MANLIITYWRDIPSAVSVKIGRKEEKRMLADRFQEAIDMAAMRGGASDILSAYSGNSLLGKEIERRAGHVDFLVCGHTHVPVPDQELHSIRCLNVGADYGRFRGVMYDADTRQIRWVGEPVPDAA